MTRVRRKERNTKARQGSASQDNSEPIWLSLYGDINEEFRYERIQADFTALELRVTGSDGRLMLTLPRQEIQGIEVMELTGGGCLLIRTEAENLEALRFTLPYLENCRKAIPQVLGWIENTRPTDTGKNTAAQAAGGICTSCGRRAKGNASTCFRCSRKWGTVSQLLSRSRKYRRPMLGMGAILLATVLLGLVPPYLTKFIIDEIAAPAGQFSSLIWLAGGLAGSYLALTLFQMLKGFIAISVGGRFLGEIRRDMFHSLMNQSMRFFDSRQVSQFIGRINQDSDRLRDFLSQGIVEFISQMLSALFIFGMLLSLNWRLTLMVMVPLPFIAAGLFWLLPKARNMWYAQWRSSIRIQSLIGEALQGIRVIKAFSREQSEKERFDQANDQLVRRMVSIQNLWMMVTPGFSLLISLFAALVWLAGGRHVLGGEMSIGTLSAYAAYLGMFFGPVRWLAQSAGWLNEVIGSAERIFDVIHTSPGVTDPQNPQPTGRAKGEIRFKKVRFGYGQDRQVLKNIDLHISPGEMVGLVGPSGAGKSTLIHLLCRFYDPDEGVVELDGISLNRYRQEELRSNIGVVLQETFLFDGTIAQNIAYGRPDASAEDIIAAASAANAHDFICRLPDGYETKVGERGHRLSGGEKQRIAIARAILLDPPILILDEATSSVDTETEAVIQGALNTLVKGRTTIAIAHRLSTLRNADRLIVMEDGQVIESGSHGELLQQNSTYARLIHAGNPGAISKREVAAI